jgi:ribonuclease-3
LRSLGELLNEQDESRQILGNETFEQCLSLQQNLQNFNSAETPSKSPINNIPKSVSHISITPWTAADIPRTLPPLPEVLDPTLKAAAFIHQGITSGRDTDLSYERLEWVGDAYLYITSTLLISQTFPTLSPGKCSQMRERIVKNVQLAEYAKQYGFESRAKLPEHESFKLQHEKAKIFGDMFEAYVAAVILSDPVNGVTKCSEWLKTVWSMTLEKDIRVAERETKFNSPLWNLRGAVDVVEFNTPKERQELPPKDRLRKLIVSPGIQLTYRESAPVKQDAKNKLTMFSIGVYLTGWGEQDKQLGYGTGTGKKEAGFKAAEMALANTKLINGYAEKKRLFDLQQKLEKKALEGVE